jgi:hypothetical protein
MIWGFIGARLLIEHRFRVYWQAYYILVNVITPGSAAQPEVLQASNIQVDRHVGQKRRRRPRDPTSRDVDVRGICQE